MIYKMISSIYAKECSNFHPIITSGLLHNGMQSLPGVSINDKIYISLADLSLWHDDFIFVIRYASNNKYMFFTANTQTVKHTLLWEKHLLLFAIKAHTNKNIWSVAQCQV